MILLYLYIAIFLNHRHPYQSILTAVSGLMSPHRQQYHQKWNLPETTFQSMLFTTSSPKGNDRSPESNVPRSICPKTLCSLSPTPVMLHIKFDQHWPTGFRDVKFKSVKFCHSKASNSKMSGLIWLKIEHDQAFMPVLATSNFDDDSIKNEQASMETPFSHYKSMGNFLDAQGQLTP